MLIRVRDFGNTHQERFQEPAVARETFAAIGVIVDALAAADIAKRSASASTRSDRKEAVRQTLSDLLVKVSQTARLLREKGYTVPALEMPTPRTARGLLSAARQFARDAAPFEEAFVAHGMQLKGIPGAADAFEAALRDGGMSRADHIAARTRIQELLVSASPHLRTVDVIVNNELGGDKAIQAVWTRARRIEDARRPRGATVAESPTITPTPATDDATKAA
jgi:hypothetical protein